MKKLQRFYYCHLENKNLEKLVIVAGEKDIRSVGLTPQDSTKKYQLGTILFNMVEFLSEHMDELQGNVTKAVIEKMVNEHVAKYNVGIRFDIYVECLKTLLYALPKDDKAKNVFFDRIRNYFSFIENCPREKQNCNLNSLLLFNSKFSESFKTGEKLISYTGVNTEYKVMDNEKMLSFLRSNDSAKKDNDMHHKEYVERIKLFGLDEFLEQSNDICILTYYKIDTIVDLITAPLQAILASKNTIELCKECNRYFVPVNKRNTQFCNNPDRTNARNKTCRQVKACYRNTKVYSGDTITRHYIRIKNRLKNRVEYSGIKISKDVLAIRKSQYDAFICACSKYVDQIKKEECTKEEYLKWLKKQDELTKVLPK